MIDFGYKPNASRSIDLDEKEDFLLDLIFREVPSFRKCFACGGCSSTCSAGQHTDFSILKCNLLLRRGEYKTLRKELDKCMLCGKCTLVCPRNVNTRAMIINMRLLLNQYE